MSMAFQSSTTGMHKHIKRGYTEAWTPRKGINTFGKKSDFKNALPTLKIMSNGTVGLF